MKLLTWIIKMAKKVLSLDSTTGGHSWANVNELPTGTNAQTLIHNGTNWVASSTISVDSSRVTISKQLRMTTNQITFSAGGIDGSETTKLALKWADANSYWYDGISIAKLTGLISLHNTVKLVNYTGTGTQLIEATADGTLQRSSAVIPPAQVNADWNATIGSAVILNKPTVYNRIEFTSNPIATPSTSYAFSNVDMSLDNVNLINKVKNVKSYIIQNGTTALDNSLIQGEIIEANQITVVCNSALFAGDVIKMYIEYE